MTTQSTTHNPEQIASDPASSFANPEDVLSAEGLSREQKIELLKQLAYDATEADVATEEGMPGNDESPVQRILLALRRLNANTDASRTDPSKQHALLSRLP